MGLHFITGGMRSTPTTVMESMSGLHNLYETRKEKVLIQAEKYNRLETHPLNEENQDITVCLNIPGIEAKTNKSVVAKKTLTLEHLSIHYPSEHWIYVY